MTFFSDLRETNNDHRPRHVAISTSRRSSASMQSVLVKKIAIGSMG